MTLTERARLIRKAMDTAAATLTDEQALTCTQLYKSWSTLVREGYTAVDVDFRFRHDDQLFKTMQPNYTFVDTYVPGTVGTESLFAKIDETHAGTLEDPIPYTGNMELFEGKYYSENGIVYLCNRSTGQPVYHALTALVGLYVEAIN